MPRARSLSDDNWRHLLQVASGMLVHTDGDLREAMRRAIAAHVDLIEGVHAESVRAAVQGGEVTLVVPEEGGLGLIARRTPTKTLDTSEVNVRAPLEIDFDVVEVKSSYIQSSAVRDDVWIDEDLWD